MGFGILKLFRDDQIISIFELSQMGGQVSAGQVECLLNEPVGEPIRFGLEDQQSHYSQSGGLVDCLVEDDWFVGH